MRFQIPDQNVGVPLTKKVAVLVAILMTAGAVAFVFRAVSSFVADYGARSGAMERNRIGGAAGDLEQQREDRAVIGNCAESTHTSNASTAAHYTQRDASTSVGSAERSGTSRPS